MANGVVGGVMCLITGARGAKRAVPPWTVSSTAGFPDSSGKPAQPGAHATRTSSVRFSVLGDTNLLFKFNGAGRGSV